MPSGIGYTITIPIRQVDSQDVLDAFCSLNNYQEKVDLGFGVLEPNPVSKEQFVAACCTQFMLNIYKNYMIEKAESDARTEAIEQSAQRAREVSSWFDNLRAETFDPNIFNNFPVCIGGSSYQTFENEPISIKLYANDPANLPLTFEVSPSDNYTFTLNDNDLTVNPKNNFVGYLQVYFKAYNGSKYSLQENHTVEVLSDVPVGQSSNITAVKNTPEDIVLLGFDPKNKPLSFTLVALPLNGNVTLNGNTATYTPNNDILGGDVFSYTVSNGTKTSAEFFINIDILES